MIYINMWGTNRDMMLSLSQPVNQLVKSVDQLPWLQSCLP